MINFKSLYELRNKAIVSPSHGVQELAAQIAAIFRELFANTFTTDHGMFQNFPGNSDRDTVVKHRFPAPFPARFVRIYPQTYHGYTFMRFELYKR